MLPVTLVLYAKSLPSAGVPVQVHFAGETLLIDGPQPLRVPAAALKISKGGFDDDGLILSWEADGIAYSLTALERAVQQALLAQAPASLTPQLAQWRGQVGAQRFKWHAVLATLAALAMGTLLLFWKSEQAAGWLASKVSPERELKLGQAALAQIKSEGELRQDGVAAEAVKTIGARLTAGSRYQYQWFVKDDEQVNAFALPGGIVVVHSALIEKAESAEELAGVLAHEVQHIERRHTLQHMIHSAGWALVLAFALGDVSSLTAILIHQAGNLSHSRGLETEADTEGVLALVRADISPRGMATFFERMAKQESFDIALLSTHPASSERLAEIETLVKENPCACQPLAYDWAAIRQTGVP